MIYPGILAPLKRVKSKMFNLSETRSFWLRNLDIDLCDASHVHRDIRMILPKYFGMKGVKTVDVFYCRNDYALQ